MERNVPHDSRLPAHLASDAMRKRPETLASRRVDKAELVQHAGDTIRI
jgi:hypothetical protein